MAIAEEHSHIADLHLALGSSLAVSPACDMPRVAGESSSGHLVICNFQRTPLTDLADFQIFSDTDLVMRLLMERLGLSLPPFRLERRLIFEVAADGSEVSARAVDVHDPSFEIGILLGVDWAGTGTKASAVRVNGNVADVVASRFGGHKMERNALDMSSLSPVCHFVGHYREPPFQVHIGSELTEHCGLDMLLSFDPYSFSWTCINKKALSDTELRQRAPVCSQESAQGSGVRSSGYGSSHREYCIEGTMKKYSKTRSQAEKMVNDRAREAVAQAKKTFQVGFRKQVWPPVIISILRSLLYSLSLSGLLRTLLARAHMSVQT